MEFQIGVNLPYFGFFLLLYCLLAYTSLPTHIKRIALAYHRYSENKMHCIVHGTILYEDIFALEEEVDINADSVKNKNVLKVEEDVKVEEIKIKEPIKFEDKYLSSFKKFSDEYFFTEAELLLKINKFSELKAEFLADRTKTYYNIHNLLIEALKILSYGPHINDNVKNALVKYFEIEDDYNDDPSNIDFDELYIYVENDSKRFVSELDSLDTDEWTPELETAIQEKALQYVLDLKLDGFMNNYILEFTPLGNVYMRYNNQKKTFEYYSNSTIPYRYLETIGRKYVMTFRCKSLFFDLEEELKIASEKASNEESKEKEQASTTIVQKPIFKSYNNDLKMNKNMMKGRPVVQPLQMMPNLPNVNDSNKENQVLKENANRYTWIDRLSNLQLLKKVDRKTVDKNYALSFSDFKKMQEIKK